MKNKKIKLTSKVLKNTLTFSAVLLTLSGPVLPLAAQAVDSSQETTTEANQEVDSLMTNQLGEKDVAPEQTSDQVVEKDELVGSGAAVSTTAEFNAAITSKDVDNIFLVKDISLNSSLAAPNLGEGRTKQIIGSGFELDMKTYKLAGAKDGAYKLSDVAIKNNNLEGGPFSIEKNIEKTSGNTVTYSNVTHLYGGSLLRVGTGTAKLLGNVSSYVDADRSSIDGANIIFDENSKINLTAPGTVISMNDAYGNVDVLKGADVTVTSRTVKTDIPSMKTAGMSVRDGAKLKVTGLGNALQITFVAGLKVAPQASVDLISLGSSALGGRGVEIPLKMPFSIQSNAGIKTWGVGKTNDTNPSNFYSGPLTASFELTANKPATEAENKAAQTNFTSNNIEFQNNFVALSTGRISTGNFTVDPNYKEPTLEVPEKIEIEKGDAFDPLKVSGLKAKDYQGKDLTNSIKATSDVDTQKPGEYTVTYSVTDFTGKTVTKTMKVVVKKGMEETTLGSLTTDSTQAVGTAEPNSTIVIKAGDKEIGRGTVGSDGKYNLTIPKQAAETKVTATATMNGKESSVSTIVTQGTIKETTISELTTDSTQVVGTAEPNSTIVIKVGDKEIGRGTVGSDGKYSLTIPKQVVGTKVTAVASLGGKESSATTTVIQGNIRETTINELTSDSTQAIGTGEPNATIIIKVGDKEIVRGTIGNDGTYNFTIPKQPVGTTVTATATAKGKESSASTTVSQGAMDYNLTATDYVAGSQTLTGTYGKNVSKVRLFVNGKVVAQAATVNGTYTFDNVQLFITDPKDKVEVVAVDGQYKEVNRVQVKVTGDPIADYSLTATDYVTGTKTLTGTYGNGVSKVRLFVNGKVAVQATTTNGKYTFDNVQNFITSSKDKVEVVAVDAQYKEVNRIPVKITGNPIFNYNLTAKDYVTGTKTLTGTYGLDVSKVRLFVNGKVVAQAATVNGTYTFDNVQNFIVSPKDKVEVVAVDGQYKEVNRIQVKVTGDATLDYSLTAKDYVAGSQTLTGTYGKNVSKVRLFVNGKVVAQAATVSGTYTFDNVELFITDPKDKVEVVAVDGQYKEVNRISVKVTGEIKMDYSLTVNDHKLGQNTLEGTKGKNVAMVRLSIDNKVVKQASVDGDTFILQGIATLIKKDSKNVEIIGVDAQYKEVNRIPVTVK